MSRHQIGTGGYFLVCFTYNSARRLFFKIGQLYRSQGGYLGPQDLVADRMTDSTIHAEHGEFFAPLDAAFLADVGVANIIVTGNVAVIVETANGAGRLGPWF